MADLKKLSIESWEKWVVISKCVGNQTPITRQELVDVLADYSDIDGLFRDVQKRKLANKREKYEELIPAGFKNAPTSVKKKWEELKNTDDAETMKWIQDNISYNADHTMNILKLKKTFCEDISGQNKRFTFEQAQELSKQTGYTLMTDYNNIDIEEEKTQTDWYQVINIFSQGNGDTPQWMVMFRDMAWCDDIYWTATPYKDKNWNELKGVVCDRTLVKSTFNSSCSNTDTHNRVCGFKDSM